MNAFLKLAVTAFYIWMFTVAVTSFKPDANMKASRHLGNVSASYLCDLSGDDAL
jgi:hypothetical protein